jgi:hypothetical protein
MDPPMTSVEITTRNLAISSRSHCYVTLASLPDSFDSSYLTISDLDHCIVDLLSPTCNAGNDEEPHQREVANPSVLQVYNIHNSILCLPVIAGSVLLHDVSSCVIIVGCHQVGLICLARYPNLIIVVLAVPDAQLSGSGRVPPESI